VDTVSIVLPGHIRRLQHLEVLGLPWTSKLNCNIPSDIVDLPRLSRLTGPISSVLPEGIGKAKSLHTMLGFCLLKRAHQKVLRGLATHQSANLDNLYWRTVPKDGQMDDCSEFFP
jgi:hypothetical protein